MNLHLHRTGGGQPPVSDLIAIEPDGSFITPAHWPPSQDGTEFTYQVTTLGTGHLPGYARALKALEKRR